MLRVLRIFRIFRILRAFRVFKAARGLQIIVESLASSLPALGNLGCMLLLVFFIFAALSVSLFGTVCVEGESGLAGMGAVRCFMAGDNVVGLHSNFRHMGEAIGTLFRCSTGDAWRDILDVIGQLPADDKRAISSLEWDKMSDLLGYDAKNLSPEDPRYIPRLFSSNGRMEMAKIAIRNWNASVYGMDNDPDWPAPATVPVAARWIALATMALPGCLSDDHVFELESEGLMDCSQVSQDPRVYAPPLARKGNRCQSTCAVGGELNYVIASFFFALFVVISNFVILQLVIAVLMDQLEDKEKAERDTTNDIVIGTEELQVHVFKRVFQRFKKRAMMKSFHEITQRARQQRHAAAHIADNAGSSLEIVGTTENS